MKHIACPVALHPDGAPLRIAVQLHAKKGPKLITGKAKESTDVPLKAARKLLTVSGLETRNTLQIGTCNTIEQDALWHFVLCRISSPVRPSWAHLPQDTKADMRIFKWLDLADSDADLIHVHSTKAIEWLWANL